MTGMTDIDKYPTTKSSCVKITVRYTVYHNYNDVNLCGNYDTLEEAKEDMISFSKQGVNKDIHFFKHTTVATYKTTDEYIK